MLFQIHLHNPTSTIDAESVSAPSRVHFANQNIGPFHPAATLIACSIVLLVIPYMVYRNFMSDHFKRKRAFWQ